MARACPACYVGVLPGDPCCTNCGQRLPPSCGVCGSERIAVARRFSATGRQALVAGAILLPVFGIGLVLILLALGLMRRDVRCLDCSAEYTVE